MTTAALLPPLPTRRSFLWSLASVGVAGKAWAARSDRNSETVYRLATPACEVQLSVEYFSNSEVNSLRFRDFLSRHSFCLSATGEEDPNCAQRFSGSLAIAHYRFRSHRHAPLPLNLRERVLTIDHDSRLDPRPPFEGLVKVQSGIASDIQAFGYTSTTSTAKNVPLWCLLRQDLFLDHDPTAFLIVHWKHTFDEIQLLDLVPGEQTQLIRA
jgi:hypothetical protein